MQSEIKLQIILTKPPPGVMFGLKKGSGSHYETVHTQISTSNDLSFEFSIKVEGDKSKDKLPKFSGSFVQGPQQISLSTSILVHMPDKLKQLGPDDLKYLLRVLPGKILIHQQAVPYFRRAYPEPVKMAAQTAQL